MILPIPNQIGLPEKFTEWRENQDLACASQLEPSPRFLIQVCPTGFGKSVVYIAASQFYRRTIILTSTKGLQTQLINEFGSMPGVVDIRGKANYFCRLNTKVTCDSGMCSFGIRCRLREEGGCFYYDRWKAATRAKVVITNYAYWMTQNEYGEGIGRFDLMILDEAHDSPDHVINHISVSFNKKSRVNSILRLDDSLPNDVETWIDWGYEKLGEVRENMEWAKLNRKEKKFIELKNLESKLIRLTSNMNPTWIWEDNYNELTLSPIWPSPYAEDVLFLGISKVVFTSATIVPKTASLLGVQSYKFEEFPHSFPIENRPLIHIPTVRMNYRNGPLEDRQWLMKLDAIIRDRQEMKGIVHTISYARRDLVMEKSVFKNLMVTHNSGDTEKVVRKFKKMEGPAILVSPSMTTGWDFPDDECRWQVILKLPFPDTRGAITKKRSEKDKDYLSYLVMQQLIQATGRGTRNKEDYCETFITDNNIEWFLPNNKHLSVKWFDGTYSVQNVIPKPRRK